VPARTAYCWFQRGSPESREKVLDWQHGNMWNNSRQIPRRCSLCPETNFDHKRGRCYGFANVACSLSLTESGSGRHSTTQHIHAAHATSKAFTSSTQQHHPWNCTCICTGSRGRPRCDVTPDQRLHLACILDSFCRMMLTVMRKRCVVAGDALLHFDFIRQQKDPMGGSVSVPNQSCFA
jgi:hypothetical protein